ncbi:hypothetical protein WICPIJ_005281 [Wickerhamomyces pijperi]|uniref:Uncharacterized protein n=1 Tax=Wickerhamomyces pijperi TaxID=599730 RepID=A0A9P8Q3X2_WICPI|nr:hypothetical protein WICPIJ_005281 [Wickerhamomyces pijperi]
MGSSQVVPQRRELNTGGNVGDLNTINTTTSWQIPGSNGRVQPCRDQPSAVWREVQRRDTVRVPPQDSDNLLSDSVDDHNGQIV